MFTSLRSLEIAFKAPRSNGQMTGLAIRIEGIISSINCPTLEQISFSLDLTGFICATRHDMTYLTPPMAKVRSHINGIMIDRMVTATGRSVFAQLSIARVTLHFRCNLQLWDESAIRDAAEDFLQRFRIFFTVWESRGILDLSCNTAAGSFRIPSIISAII